MPTTSTPARPGRTPGARRRLAELHAREQVRRRRRLGFGAGSLVLLIVAALVVVRLAVGHSSAPAATRADESQLAAQLADVPVSAVNAVGKGTPDASPIPVTTTTPLAADGKPRVVYVGAEFCPYCAAERWAVVQALSRFGTFSGLGTTSSDPADVFPATATLSFHGATYTSDYLSFTGVETEDNTRQPLDTAPADVQALLSTYDTAPYTSQPGSIPFVDFGGAAVTVGATYSPALLSGKTQSQIAAAVADPSTAISKAVLGEANRITATLCTLTDNKPAAVCTAPGVTAAAGA